MPLPVRPGGRGWWSLLRELCEKLGSGMCRGRVRLSQPSLNIASFCNSVAMEEKLLDFVLLLDAVVIGAV